MAAWPGFILPTDNGHSCVRCSHPQRAPDGPAPTTGGPSRVFSTCSSLAAAGRTCRVSMAPPRRSGGDSNGGGRGHLGTHVVRGVNANIEFDPPPQTENCCASFLL